MEDKDNRFECSDEKKSKIKMTKTMTSLRRKNQVCKVFECKIVEKRLNKKQKEYYLKNLDDQYAEVENKKKEYRN